jgi:hypothetical protein
MNTNETKAKLWNMCIEKGVFNKVKGENFNKMQETFERIVKGYEQVEPSLEVFNKVIDSLSIEIQNNFMEPMVQKQTLTQSLTQTQILTQPHSQIDTQNKIQDAPILTYESIQKEYDKLLNVPPPKQIDFTDVAIKPKSLKLEEIIMTQNKILMQILETQVKIIDILKK